MSEKNIHKTKSKSISNYNKKHLLRGLIETNANPEKQQIVFGRFESISKDPTVARSTNFDLLRFNFHNIYFFIFIFLDYINERANDSQKRVEYSMKQSNNKSFDILNKSAILLNNKLNPIISVALESISEYEDHPSTDDLNGIDLKQLYKWMANLLAGYPVDIQEGPTKEFLENCYKVRFKEENFVFVLFLLIYLCLILLHRN